MTGSCLSRGSLSRGVSVQEGLCPGGSLSWGVSVQGGLCPAGVCPEVLCLGSSLSGGLSRGVSVQGGGLCLGSLFARGASVWGPLSKRGLSPGRSLSMETPSSDGTHPTGIQSCLI